MPGIIPIIVAVAYLWPGYTDPGPPVVGPIAVVSGTLTPATLAQSSICTIRPSGWTICK